MTKILRLVIHLFILLLAANLHTNTKADVADYACNNEISFSDDASIYKLHVPQTSICCYKIQGKRKIKIKFRARYIQFSAPSAFVEESKCYTGSVAVSTYQGACIHSSYSASFQLRGPPSVALA